MRPGALCKTNSKRLPLVDLVIGGISQRNAAKGRSGHLRQGKCAELLVALPKGQRFTIGDRFVVLRDNVFVDVRGEDV